MYTEQQGMLTNECIESSGPYNLSPISFNGWSTPISLLTIMMDAREVSGRMDRSRSCRIRGRGRHTTLASCRRECVGVCGSVCGSVGECGECVGEFVGVCGSVCGRVCGRVWESVWRVCGRVWGVCGSVGVWGVWESVWGVCGRVCGRGVGSGWESEREVWESDARVCGECGGECVVERCWEAVGECEREVWESGERVWGECGGECVWESGERVECAEECAIECAVERCADHTSRLIMPFFCTGRYVTSCPSFSIARHESSTHLCSWAEQYQNTLAHT